jgi:hypothetical protein
LKHGAAFAPVFGFVAFVPNPASGNRRGRRIWDHGRRLVNRLGLPPMQTVNDLIAGFKFL